VDGWKKMTLALLGEAVAPVVGLAEVELVQEPAQYLPQRV
jgi:hypothetical protein